MTWNGVYPFDFRFNGRKWVHTEWISVLIYFIVELLLYAYLNAIFEGGDAIYKNENNCQLEDGFLFVMWLNFKIFKMKHLNLFYQNIWKAVKCPKMFWLPYWMNWKESDNDNWIRRKTQGIPIVPSQDIFGFFSFKHSNKKETNRFNQFGNKPLGVLKVLWRLIWKREFSLRG